MLSLESWTVWFNERVTQSGIQTIVVSTQMNPEMVAMLHWISVQTESLVECFSEKSGKCDEFVIQLHTL